MTAEEYLNRYKQMSARVKTLKAEVERIRTMAESMGINLDGMPHGSNVSDKIARLAVELAEYESALVAEITAVNREAMKIIEMIGKIKDPNQQTLLYKRYIEEKKWGEIAVELRYTYQWVSGPLHTRAVRSFQKIMEEE